MADDKRTEPYKVPKEKILVQLKIPPSAPLWHTVFLSSCAKNHRGQETISDLFNTPSAFLPLQREDGVITVIRRDSIRWIKVKDAEKSEWYYYEVREGAPQSRVRFEFDDGETLEGSVYCIGPAGEQRILDVVNKPGPFLQLETGMSLYLVNISHISIISFVEEPDGGPR
jgi:hypothetical protein